VDRRGVAVLFSSEHTQITSIDVMTVKVDVKPVRSLNPH